MGVTLHKLNLKKQEKKLFEIIYETINKYQKHEELVKKKVRHGIAYIFMRNKFIKDEAKISIHKS